MPLRPQREPQMVVARRTQPGFSPSRLIQPGLTTVRYLQARCVSGQPCRVVQVREQHTEHGCASMHAPLRTHARGSLASASFTSTTSTMPMPRCGPSTGTSNFGSMLVIMTSLARRRTSWRGLSLADLAQGAFTENAHDCLFESTTPQWI